MRLAVIQNVDWVPVAYCDLCEQDMPADHRIHHINSETAPDATGAASDPHERNHQ